MNVLIATCLVASSPSGEVTYSQKLATELAKAGYTIHIVYSSPWQWRKGLGLLKRITRPCGTIAQVVYESSSLI